jgi:hypothetical protein
MTSVRRKSWLPANLLLVILLTGAQSGALVHAFQHDSGTLQNQACAICVTVSQLDSGCIDALATTDIEGCYSCRTIARAAKLTSLHTLAANQRGPPRSL